MRAHCNFVMSYTNVRYGYYDFLGKKPSGRKKIRNSPTKGQILLTESFIGPTSSRAMVPSVFGTWY